jgi:hypothetical protein
MVCSFDLILLTIVLSVIVNHCLFCWSYSFDHCVVCHCKSSMVKRIRSKEQTMIYNDRQHNGQQNKIKWRNNDLQWQTINTMSKGIRSKVIVNHCLFFWSYSFDHCIVCHCKSLFVLLILFFWPLCCLSL